VKLTKFALNRPVTVLMVFLSVILIGFISWQRLSVELLPSMNYPQITILTTYENVAPPEIETLISKPIEEALGTVKGVKRIESLSKEGMSLVTLDFELGVDTNVSALDVREKIDVVKGSLPRDIENPIIAKFDGASFLDGFSIKLLTFIRLDSMETGSITPYLCMSSSLTSCIPNTLEPVFSN